MRVAVAQAARCPVPPSGPTIRGRSADRTPRGGGGHRSRGGYRPPGVIGRGGEGSRTTVIFTTHTETRKKLISTMKLLFYDCSYLKSDFNQTLKNLFIGKTIYLRQENICRDIPQPLLDKLWPKGGVLSTFSSARCLHGLEARTPGSFHLKSQSCNSPTDDPARSLSIS